MGAVWAGCKGVTVMGAVWAGCKGVTVVGAVWAGCKVVTMGCCLGRLQRCHGGWAVNVTTRFPDPGA